MASDLWYLLRQQSSLDFSGLFKLALLPTHPQVFHGRADLVGDRSEEFEVEGVIGLSRCFVSQPDKTNQLPFEFHGQNEIDLRSLELEPLMFG